MMGKENKLSLDTYYIFNNGLTKDIVKLVSIDTESNQVIIQNLDGIEWKESIDQAKEHLFMEFNFIFTEDEK